MDPLHERIVRIALDSIGRDHGFALAGECGVQTHRSLLFVAATRARDELVVTWHGDTQPAPLGPAG